MNPVDFVEGLKSHARDSAAIEVLELLRSPPGRGPSSDLREISDWYRALPASDQAMVARVARLSAGHCLFGTLCILDGARKAYAGDEVQFRLSATRGSVTYPLSPGPAFLHDLCGDDAPPPAPA